MYPLARDHITYCRYNNYYNNNAVFSLSKEGKQRMECKYEDISDMLRLQTPLRIFH